eukprot:tig00000737_g3791.t1
MLGQGAPPPLAAFVPQALRQALRIDAGRAPPSAGEAEASELEVDPQQCSFRTYEAVLLVADLSGFSALASRLVADANAGPPPQLRARRVSEQGSIELPEPAAAAPEGVGGVHSEEDSDPASAEIESNSEEERAELTAAELDVIARRKKNKVDAQERMKRERERWAADHLSRKVNEVLADMLAIAAEYEMDAIKFAGDAITLMKPYAGGSSARADEAASAALECAARLLKAVSNSVHFSLHCALGMGTVLELHAGLPSRREMVLLGLPVKQVSDGIGLSKSGQVAVHVSAFLRISVRRPIPAANPTKAGDDKHFHVISLGELSSAGFLRSETERGAARRIEGFGGVWPPGAPLGVVDPREAERLGPYVPEEVLRLLQGNPMSTFWSELRTISAAFVQVPLPFDVARAVAVSGGAGRVRSILASVSLAGFLPPPDSDAPSTPPASDPFGVLDACIREVQSAVADTEGSFRQFLVDDKGATAFATWGVSQAHTDDGERAVAAAIRIRTALARIGTGAVAIGITSGRVYCGLIGNAARADYTVLGDPINMASRLMGLGRGIVVDRATVAALPQPEPFLVTPLGTVAVKGKEEGIEAFRVEGYAPRASLTTRLLASIGTGGAPGEDREDRVAGEGRAPAARPQSPVSEIVDLQLHMARGDGRPASPSDAARRDTPPAPGRTLEESAVAGGVAQPQFQPITFLRPSSDMALGSSARQRPSSLSPSIRPQVPGHFPVDALGGGSGPGSGLGSGLGSVPESLASASTAVSMSNGSPVLLPRAPGSPLQRLAMPERERGSPRLAGANMRLNNSYPSFANWPPASSDDDNPPQSGSGVERSAKGGSQPGTPPMRCQLPEAALEQALALPTLSFSLASGLGISSLNRGRSFRFRDRGRNANLTPRGDESGRGGGFAAGMDPAWLASGAAGGSMRGNSSQQSSRLPSDSVGSTFSRSSSVRKRGAPGRNSLTWSPLSAAEGFVGRHSELLALEDFVLSCERLRPLLPPSAPPAPLRGHGEPGEGPGRRLLLVEGGPGVGKSALANLVAAWLPTVAGVKVLVASARSGPPELPESDPDDGVPFAAFRGAVYGSASDREATAPEGAPGGSPPPKEEEVSPASGAGAGAAGLASRLKPPRRWAARRLGVPGAPGGDLLSTVRRRRAASIDGQSSERARELDARFHREVLRAVVEALFGLEPSLAIYAEIVCSSLGLGLDAHVALGEDPDSGIEAFTSASGAEGSSAAASQSNASAFSGERSRAMRALVGLFDKKCKAEPTVIVLEDVDKFDRASLDLFAELHRLPRGPCAFLATTAARTIPESPACSRILAHPSTEVLPLGAMGEADAEALVAAAIGLDIASVDEEDAAPALSTPPGEAGPVRSPDGLTPEKWLVHTLHVQARGNPGRMLDMLEVLMLHRSITVSKGRIVSLDSEDVAEVAQLGATKTGEAVIARSLGALRGRAAATTALPDSFEKVVFSRLDAMDPLDALVCSLLSVLSSAFSVPIAAAVCGPDLPASEEGEESVARVAERIRALVDNGWLMERQPKVPSRKSSLLAGGGGGEDAATLLGWRRRRSQSMIPASESPLGGGTPRIASGLTGQSPGASPLPLPVAPAPAQLDRDRSRERENGAGSPMTVDGAAASPGAAHSPVAGNSGGAPSSVGSGLDILERDAGEGAGRGGLFGFLHGATRDILYARLTEERRRLLHLRAAAALEALSPAEREQMGVSATALAAHFNSAGVKERAVHFLTVAGQAAVQSGSLTKAIAALEDAVQLGGPMPKEDGAEGEGEGAAAAASTKKRASVSRGAEAEEGSVRQGRIMAELLAIARSRSVAAGDGPLRPAAPTSNALRRRQVVMRAVLLARVYVLSGRLLSSRTVLEQTLKTWPRTAELVAVPRARKSPASAPPKQGGATSPRSPAGPGGAPAAKAEAQSLFMQRLGFAKLSLRAAACASAHTRASRTWSQGNSVAPDDLDPAVCGALCSGLFGCRPSQSAFGSIRGGALFNSVRGGTAFASVRGGNAFSSVRDGGMFGSVRAGNLFGSVRGGGIFGSVRGGTVFSEGVAAPWETAGALNAGESGAESERGEATWGGELTEEDCRDEALAVYERLLRHAGENARAARVAVARWTMLSPQADVARRAEAAARAATALEWVGGRLAAAAAARLRALVTDWMHVLPTQKERQTLHKAAVLEDEARAAVGRGRVESAVMAARQGRLLSQNLSHTAHGALELLLIEAVALFHGGKLRECSEAVRELKWLASSAPSQPHLCWAALLRAQLQMLTSLAPEAVSTTENAMLLARTCDTGTSRGGRDPNQSGRRANRLVFETGLLVERRAAAALLSRAVCQAGSGPGAEEAALKEALEGPESYLRAAGGGDGLDAPLECFALCSLMDAVALSHRRHADDVGSAASPVSAAGPAGVEQTGGPGSWLSRLLSKLAPAKQQPARPSSSAASVWELRRAGAMRGRRGQYGRLLALLEGEQGRGGQRRLLEAAALVQRAVWEREFEGRPEAAARLALRALVAAREAGLAAWEARALEELAAGEPDPQAARELLDRSRLLLGASLL